MEGVPQVLPQSVLQGGQRRHGHAEEARIGAGRESAGLETSCVEGAQAVRMVVLHEGEGRAPEDPAEDAACAGLVEVEERVPGHCPDEGEGVELETGLGLNMQS